MRDTAESISRLLDIKNDKFIFSCWNFEKQRYLLTLSTLLGHSARGLCNMCRLQIKGTFSKLELEMAFRHKEIKVTFWDMSFSAQIMTNVVRKNGSFKFIFCHKSSIFFREKIVINALKEKCAILNLIWYYNRIYRENMLSVKQKLI